MAGAAKRIFPARNASMNGCGVATAVIVEANEHSGTRAQARQAQHHGYPIIIRDAVVEQTKWGKRLEGNPSVYAVTTVEDVSRAIDVILDSDSLLRIPCAEWSPRRPSIRIGTR